MPLDCTKRCPPPTRTPPPPSTISATSTPPPSTPDPTTPKKVPPSPSSHDPNLPPFHDPNPPSFHSPDAAPSLLEDDSPYLEVRSAVANTDDPALPVATLRAWTLGVLWAVLIPGLNQFFFFRYPAVTVTSVRGAFFWPFTFWPYR
ncbi:hypothetical protein B0H16DRAFT_1884906 [Mycena metata]|uniref:Uncharacterized protein n=1 Tax=Mycena metata TaxID=1033252 RepID=A0AAD7JBE5_9AGAR|nr:hypothetical protein B0H16DRAFT_1884906 [Mycena metata]